MTNVYMISRKIHRILVLIILVLGLLMTITGILLKYTSIATEYLTRIDLNFVRYLHNQLSTYFGAILILMTITGIWMYFYPSWTAHKAKNRQINSDQETRERQQ